MQRRLQNQQRNAVRRHRNCATGRWRRFKLEKCFSKLPCMFHNRSWWNRRAASRDYSWDAQRERHCCHPLRLRRLLLIGMRQRLRTNQYTWEWTDKTRLPGSFDRQREPVQADTPVSDESGHGGFACSSEWPLESESPTSFRDECAGLTDPS